MGQVGRARRVGLCILEIDYEPTAKQYHHSSLNPILKFEKVPLVSRVAHVPPPIARPKAIGRQINLALHHLISHYPSLISQICTMRGFNHAERLALQATKCNIAYGTPIW